MYTTVTKSDFINAFRQSDTYKNNFTYEGLSAIFDNMESYESDNGQIEFDMVDTVCHWSEYETALECCKEYADFDGSTEEEALSYLYDQTTVLELENGGVVINNF